MKLRLLYLGFAALPSVAQAQIGREPVRIADVRLVTGLTLTTSSVTGGAAVSGSVTVSQAAGGGGIEVKLQSSNPAVAAVPAGVVVQVGAQTATFVIQTYPVVTNPNVATEAPSAEITAQIGSSAAKTTRLTVLPPALASLTVTPANVGGGFPATGEVRITGPASASGFTIALSGKPTGVEPPQRNVRFSIARPGPVISVPAEVSIAAGATAATFPLSTGAVTEATPVQVTASRGPFMSKTAGFTLMPPVLSALTVVPPVPIGGNPATGTVSLMAPAPPGGVTFSVAVALHQNWCGSPAPTAPPTVQVPGGASSASFPIMTSPGRGWWDVFVGEKSAGLAVAPPAFSSPPLAIPGMSCTSTGCSASIKGGTTVEAKLQMQGVAGPPNCNGHGPYRLESSNALYAQVPVSLPLTQGAIVHPFQITTSAVTAVQTVLITVYSGPNPSDPKRWVTLTITP